MWPSPCYSQSHDVRACQVFGFSVHGSGLDTIFVVFSAFLGGGAGAGGKMEDKKEENFLKKMCLTNDSNSGFFNQETRLGMKDR